MSTFLMCWISMWSTYNYEAQSSVFHIHFNVIALYSYDREAVPLRRSREQKTVPREFFSKSQKNEYAGEKCDNIMIV